MYDLREAYRFSKIDLRHALRGSILQLATKHISGLDEQGEDDSHSSQVCHTAGVGCSSVSVESKANPEGPDSPIASVVLLM